MFQKALHWLGLCPEDRRDLDHMARPPPFVGYGQNMPLPVPGASPPLGNGDDRPTEPRDGWPEQDLASLSDYLMWQIDIEQDLGGDARRAVERVFDELAAQSRLRTEARAAILAEPMFAEKDAAAVLGIDQPGAVESLRVSSLLLAIPSDGGYLYPRFQFDTQRRAIHNTASEVNQLLEANKDPWGVAGWWLYSNDRVGARPADLLGDRQPQGDSGCAAAGAGDGSSLHNRLIAAAKAVTEPVG